MNFIRSHWIAWDFILKSSWIPSVSIGIHRIWVLKTSWLHLDSIGLIYQPPSQAGRLMSAQWKRGSRWWGDGSPMSEMPHWRSAAMSYLVAHRTHKSCHIYIYANYMYIYIIIYNYYVYNYIDIITIIYIYTICIYIYMYNCAIYI